MTATDAFETTDDFLAIQDKLDSFIRAKLLPDELKDDFGPDTPLLELGVLDSLSAARLLNFIKRQLGTNVPDALIDPQNFRSVRTITHLITTVIPAQQAG
jgi:acyl carrier protein